MVEFKEMAKKKRLLLIVFFLALIILIGYWLQQSLRFNVSQLKQLILSMGIFGPLMIMFLIIVSMVFSPIAAFPIWLASLALYGFGPTLVYILIANNLGSVINFYVARRWGRSVVTKFVGQKGLAKIDGIAEVVGLEILVLGRVFGGASGDYLSYAAGLTKMEFRPYLLITVFGTIPPIVLNILLVYKALVINPHYLIILAVIGYPLAFLLPILIYRKKTKK
jgi:uncharacterized membrane protein YdjX (TVP38/TMEM64 family)